MARLCSLPYRSASFVPRVCATVPRRCENSARDGAVSTINRPTGPKVVLSGVLVRPVEVVVDVGSPVVGVGDSPLSLPGPGGLLSGGGLIASGGRMIPGATKPGGQSGQLGRQNNEPMLQLV